METNIVWNKNNVRLYQNDCLEVMRSLPESSIDGIWTDPPYNLSNGGVTCHAGKMVRVDKGNWDRSQGVELDHAFNLLWLEECYRLLKPAGTIWVSGTMHSYPSIAFAMQQLGYRILNDIIWEKPAPPPNLGCRCFTHSTEIILWATKALKNTDKYTFHYEAMKVENGGKQMKNVWRFNPPRKNEKLHGKHPTQKPVDLIVRCLRASTNEGDTVFDPFAGSCSTAIAALRENRKFIGCELEPNYVKLALRRLADASIPLYQL